MDLYQWQEVSSVNEDDDHGDDNHRDMFNLSAHSSGSLSDRPSTDDDDCNDSDADVESSDSSACSGECLLDVQARRAARLIERLRLFSSAHPHVRGVTRLQRHIESVASSTTNGDSLRHAATVLAVLEAQPHVVAVCAAVRGPEVPEDPKSPKSPKSPKGPKGCKGSKGSKGSKGPKGPEDPKGTGAEVDVIACGGLRWLRVRGAGRRRLRVELRAADTRWTESLARLVRCAAAARLPQRRVPEVVAVFRRAPPRGLAQAVQAAGARAASIAELRAGQPPPPPPFSTRFVCLDTTALVALCSDACFMDDHEVATLALDAFPYQSEQVRRERDDRCLAAHIEPALREHMAWLPAEEFASLRGLSDATFAAAALPVDVAWMDPFIGDGAAAARESEVVREVAAARAADGSRWPNWLIADITLAEFRWVAETIAGPQELRRARALLRCCHVVSGDYARLEAAEGAETLSHVARLRAGGKIAQRNRLVFGISDVLGAVILSSNRHIISAAQDEGVEVLCIPHPARAFVEQKLRGYTRREGPRAPPPICLRKEPAHTPTV